MGGESANSPQQQVMVAQPLPAAPANEGEIQVDAAQPRGSLLSDQTATYGTMGPNEGPSAEAVGERQVPGSAPVEVENIVEQPQGPMVRGTTTDLRVRPMTGTVHREGTMTTSVAGFVTPRSTRSTEPVQNNWMGMEIPRWMSRLGTFFSVPALPSPGEFAPSPLLAENAGGPPPGGHAFVLSPPRRRQVTRPPSPPSSSSVPQEAIQAEVQRQLGGLLDRLQRAEADNAYLRDQLHSTRQSGRTIQDVSQPQALLGDLIRGPTGPGVLPAWPSSEAAGPEQNGTGARLFASDPVGVPPGQGRELSGGLFASDPVNVPSGQGRELSAGLFASDPVGVPPSTMPAEPQPGLLRSILGGRPRTPSPPPAATTVTESPVLEALATGMRQLQELQAQALARGSSSPTGESVKPGTTTLTPLPEVSTTAESALKFQDWVEVTGAAMADVSEQSSLWWGALTRVVEEAYARWLSATPLERLNVSLNGARELTEGRWVRVNARVANMLLSCMQEEIRMDMVSRRISQSCPMIMYRLYTYYQPGGPAERHDLLRRLQCPSEYGKSESMEDTIQVLRSWPRWLARCRAVNMVPPDASVLARGLMGLTAKHISSSQDSSFRTSMLRTSLRLDGQPTLEQVLAYQRHLQAELEMLHSAGTTSSTTPAVRAVEPTSTSPTNSKNKLKDKDRAGDQPCRYFAKSTGCKRGERCTFSHSMSHLDREARSKKCLKCGSEAHRQRDCPTGRPAQKATGAPPREPKAIGAAPWTLDSLVQAAQAVVQAQGAREGDSSPEKTQRPTVKVLNVKDVMVCALKESSAALLDSGATHCLRTAKSWSEWNEAEEVQVQLAGAATLMMRMSEKGSLLMPPTPEGTSASSQGQPQTIVPMGELVKTLGYTLVWAPDRCHLEDREGHRVPLNTSRGCPHLCEAEALSLIARVEDRKREQMENATLNTLDQVTIATAHMDQTWMDFMMKYVRDGNVDDGRRALRDAPFLQGIPGECLSGLVQGDIKGKGWNVFKQIEYLSRVQRRRLWSAKRWIVHVCAGDPGHWELFKLDQGETTVIELDKQRNRSHDITSSPTWRMLLWGGKADVVLGGPSGRGGFPANWAEATLSDKKAMTLVSRMLWLYAVAKAGRLQNASGAERGRPVGFVLEHPAEVKKRTGVHKQTPRNSLWETPMWEEFQEEMDMTQVSFDQRATGSSLSIPTTLGTNVLYLTALQGQGMDADTEEPKPCDEECGDDTWSSGLVGALVTSLTFWSNQPREAPALRAMTPAQWKQHVDAGHINYNRECLTCVMGRGTGRRHGRIRHPEMFTLTLDLAGPVQPGLDVTSKGTMGKGLRYLLAAKFTLPKEFVKAYTGKNPPPESGLQVTVEAQSFRDDEGEEEGERKELIKPSLQPPHEGGDQSEDLFDDPSLLKEREELKKPSLQPPHEGGDPFIYVEDEPGEQGPLFDREDEPGEQGPAHYEVQIPDEATRFIGATKNQRQAYDDGEDSLYAPSEPEINEDAGDVEAPEEPTGKGQVVVGDCEPPESVVLLFAKGLKDNSAMSVKAALQDIVLYLESFGLPVCRLHADHGETFNHSIRTWLRDRGIRATWSEPGIPQGNGRAEAAAQRATVLQLKSRLAAPYGAPVLIKQKAFDSSGPRRRDRAFESKWLRGVYVGLSGILQGGHVIYLPGTSESKEKFAHTFHVRVGLSDPGPPQDSLVVDEPPRPRRRILGKVPISDIEMRAMSLDIKALGVHAEARATDLLDAWSLTAAYSLVDELAEAGFFAERKFGVFRHGGAVGWLTGFGENPQVSRVLARLVTEVVPEATFTSIWVSRNVQRLMHVDQNNDEATYNYAIPIRVSHKGGELWVELRKGDRVSGPVKEKVNDKGQRFYGHLLCQKLGDCNVFSPRSKHEVEPWTGTRTVLIAYTPQCMGKLSYDMIQSLEDHGFQPPLSQLPEFFVRNQTAIHLSAVGVNDVKVEEEPYNVDECREGPECLYGDWEMYLKVHDGLVKVEDALGDYVDREIPMMAKAEMGYAQNVEDKLSELVAPLEVTYQVDPKEVMEHLSLWEGAIRKEVQNIEVAIVRLQRGDPVREDWLSKPGVQRLPTKFVFTIKPNSEAKSGDRTTWYKRKARLVVCGNLARQDTSELYTEAAPAEAVRMSLVLAKQRRWIVGVLDVVAAFLKTPIGTSPSHPVILIQPPKLLQALNLAAPMELWALVRALYGLRQSPALWAEHRDYTIEQTPKPPGLQMRKGRTVTSWWGVYDEKNVLVAVVLIYVDDFMLCGAEKVVEQLSAMIRSVWETSPLSVLSERNPIRFLGMELTIRGRDQGIYISQQGYVDEMLKSHGIVDKDKIPIGKDQAVYEITDADMASDEGLINLAQTLTGELLWVAQRSRPDISYSCCLLSTLTTRAPQRVVDIAYKVMRYLNRTSSYALQVKAEDNSIKLFTDAAFAPSGAKSHSGFLVMWGATPIVWRSARQATVALSTAESELIAILEGGIAVLGVEAMLYDLWIHVDSRVILSDSTSALTISSGTGSWRTRHLRIKASWLQEMLAAKTFVAVHCPGLVQPADLLTKALPSQRLQDLLELWGVGQVKEEDDAVRTIRTSSKTASERVLVAMICCMMFLGAQGRDVQVHQGPQIDYDMAGLMVILLMVLGGLVLYELARWVLIEFYREWAPGASVRKLRRLEKLRDATSRAIQEELDKRELQQRTQRRSTTTTPTSTSEPHQAASSRSAPSPRTPEATSARPTTVLRSPDGWSITSDSDFNRENEEERICTDVMMLMRCEELREALEDTGQVKTGLKNDQAQRMGRYVAARMNLRDAPTAKQFRYILWLWRARDLQGRVLLRYRDVQNRTETSRTINRWKAM